MPRTLELLQMPLLVPGLPEDPEPTEAALPRDLRATRRVRVALPLEVRQGGHLQHRSSWDLSTFGASTQEGRAPPTGSRALIALHLPDHARMPVLVEARVVGPFHGGFGARFAFLNLSAEAARRIHHFLFSGGDA